MNNPLDSFESAYNVASKGRKPLQGVMDAFDEEQKNKRELSLYNQKQEGDLGRSLSLEHGKKKIETEADTAMLEKLGMGGQGSGGFMPESYKVGNVTYKNPEYSGKLTSSRNKGFLDRKRMMGAGAQSSPINAAMQAAESSRRARKILFPDDTPQSFRADIAASKNMIGRATLSKDAQNVTREYGIALDLYNRQVTGAAFNDKEFQRRVNQFKLNLLSNPDAAYDSLKRLEELNEDYLKIADPEGLFHQIQDSQDNQSSDIESIRQQALDAINKGAPKDKVSERFRQKTGQEL